MSCNDSGIGTTILVAGAIAATNAAAVTGLQHNTIYVSAAAASTPRLSGIFVAIDV